MKKLIVVCSLFLSLAVSAQTEKYSFQNLVGTWRNSSGVGLDVVDSNTIYIVHGGQRKLASASLSDIGRNPLSFNVSIKDSSKIVVLKGLLLFVNDNTLQWQVVDSETKPVSFRYGRGDMLFLKRIDKLYN